MAEDAAALKASDANDVISARSSRFELGSWFYDGIHLAVLAAFAIAQPLFQVLAGGASFFAVRGSSALQILGFVAITVLGLPAALLFAELAVRVVLGKVARRAAHLVFVACLLGLLALQAVKRAGVTSAYISFGLAALLGVGGAAIYALWRPGRTILTVLGPAPLLFAALFLFNSPVYKLVQPGDEARAATANLPSGTPVVFLVLDEFSIESLMAPDGRIDADRFPNFAALAKTSTWYRNAATVSLATTWAVPAIVSGKYSKPEALAVYRDHPNNLFTLFGGGTYALNIHETQTRLCPGTLCPNARRTGAGTGLGSLASDIGIVYGHVILPDQLEERLPSISTSWGDFRGADLDHQLPITQTLGFERFLQSIHRSSRPTLNFLHVELPHFPYNYLPSGRRYDAPQDFIPGLKAEKWGSDPWLVLQANQRYLLQVGYVDRLVGQLLYRLEREGMLDSALIVVTADHGVSFHPDAGRRTALRYAEDLAFVPLFIKVPGQRVGETVNRPVQTIDVLPTVADALEIRIPWRTDGHSALGRLARRTLRLEGRLFSSAGLIARRDGAVRRQARLFGRGADWSRVFSIGPVRDLVGARTASLPSSQSELSARLDDEDRLRIVDPGSGFIPSFVSGTFSGRGARPGLDVAVAVNGRVAGTGRSYARGGRILFSALVPEEAFSRGSNEVRIYAVVRRGGSRAVELLARVGGVDAVRWELRGRTLRSSNGARFNLVPGRVAGVVDTVSVQDQRARFVGWAADVPNRRARDRVIVFSNGRFVYSNATVIRGGRPDLGPGLQDAGFDFAIPVGLLGAKPRVRVFAVVDDLASELRPARAYPWDR